MMQYPLVYMCIWIIPTSIRIYHATSGQQAPLPLIIIDKVFASYLIHLALGAELTSPLLVLYCVPGVC